MRKAMMLIGTVVALMIPVTASAAPPEVVEEVEESFDEIIPAGELCSFEVHLQQTLHVRVTEFSDNDGSLDRVQIRVRGTALFASEWGEAFDRWAFTVMIDLETMTAAQPGNVFNVHAGPGGILVNDSGRIVFDEATGEVLAINGPHDAFFEDPAGALCEALAP